MVDREAWFLLHPPSADESSPLRRLAVWARRARSLSKFHRLARLSGLALPLRLLEVRA